MKKLLLVLLFCFLPVQSNAAIVLIGTSGKVQTCLSQTGIAIQGGSTSSSVINCTLIDAILAIEETATVTNVIARNTRGNDIDLTSGKTLTVTYTLYDPDETTGDTPGTGCLDGGSVDPLLAGNFTLRPNSPCINTGTKAGDAGMAGFQTDINDNTYYFTPYDRMNMGADQTGSDADARPVGVGRIISGILR